MVGDKGFDTDNLRDRSPALLSQQVQPFLMITVAASQAELAEKLGGPAVAFLGDDEIAAGTVTVKLLASREQVTVRPDEAIARLKPLYTGFEDRD